MNKVILMCALSAFLISSCSSITTVPISESVPESNPIIASKDNQPRYESVESPDNSLPPLGGDENICPIHSYGFHLFEGELIMYVGNEEYKEWKDGYNQQKQDYTIVNFINDFQITRENFISIVRKPLSEKFLHTFNMTSEEEFYNSYSYTDEEIEAIFSGDKISINRAFCGPLAFVNEADGELYSIYWLAEHTPEEYVEAGLPMEEVEAVIEKAASEEFGLSEIAESAMSKMTKALALAEENSSIK